MLGCHTWKISPFVTPSTSISQQDECRSCWDAPTGASNDAALYRDIRLEALRANPEAFGSTFETGNAQTLDRFIVARHLDGARRLPRHEACRHRRLCDPAGSKAGAQGLALGDVRSPDSRKIGIGRRLVEAVLDLARQRVELIQLTVVRDMSKRAGCTRVWALSTTAWRETLSSKTVATTMRFSTAKNLLASSSARHPFSLMRRNAGEVLDCRIWPPLGGCAATSALMSAFGQADVPILAVHGPTTARRCS